MRAYRWTRRELNKLHRLYPTIPQRQVVQHFPGRTLKAIATKAKLLRISRRAQTNYRIWTPAEMAKLRSEYPDRPTKELAKEFRRPEMMVYHKAAAIGLVKSAKYMASPAACRLRRGDNVGAAFRFPPGHVPANKGLRRPGYGPGRMKETQFKKGQKPHTWKPIGSFRYFDGYLQKKMTDTGYTPRDWRMVHVMLWEQHHGKVPRNKFIVFKDRDKTNIKIENLEAITRRENMRRNTIHRWPREMKFANRMLNKLNRIVKEKTNGGDQTNSQNERLAESPVRRNRGGEGSKEGNLGRRDRARQGHRRGRANHPRKRKGGNLSPSRRPAGKK